MGQIHAPEPVLLIIAATSRHDAALEWGRKKCVESFGSIRSLSPAFDFTETEYYAATMGPGLKKQFFAFEQLIDPAALASIKRHSNHSEAEYAAVGRHAEPRPLNLDPGYITSAKLVLASTKDHAHRIYLHEGIFAEVTLSYRQRQWQPLEWTYPDYRRDDYQRFFTECREWLLNCGQRGQGVK
jgi:Domain of unknown function (DUF4416)